MEPVLGLFAFLAVAYVLNAKANVPVWAIVVISLAALFLYEALYVDRNVVIDRYGGRWFTTPDYTCKACPFSRPQSS